MIDQLLVIDDDGLWAVGTSSVNQITSDLPLAKMPAHYHFYFDRGRNKVVALHENTIVQWDVYNQTVSTSVSTA